MEDRTSAGPAPPADQQDLPSSIVEVHRLPAAGVPDSPDSRGFVEEDNLFLSVLSEQLRDSPPMSSSNKSLPVVVVAPPPRTRENYPRPAPSASAFGEQQYDVVDDPPKMPPKILDVLESAQPLGGDHAPGTPETSTAAARGTTRTLHPRQGTKGRVQQHHQGHLTAPAAPTATASPGSSTNAGVSTDRRGRFISGGLSSDGPAPAVGGKATKNESSSKTTLTTLFTEQERISDLYPRPGGPGGGTTTVTRARGETIGPSAKQLLALARKARKLQNQQAAAWRGGVAGSQGTRSGHGGGNFRSLMSDGS